MSGYDPLESSYDSVHWDQFDHTTDEGKLAYAAFKARMKESYPDPARRIKKARVCPVTGENVYHKFGLSRRAWLLLQEGLEFERRRDDSQAKLHAWSWYWTQYKAPLSATGDRQQAPDFIRLDKWVEAMFNVHVSYSTIGKLVSQGAIFLDALPKQYPSDMGCHSVMLTEKQAFGLKQMVDGFMAEFQRVSDYSFNRGSGWVTAMAEGNLSIDQVDKLAGQRALNLQRLEVK